MERGGKRGRSKTKRSKVWDHFTRHTGDDGKKRSKCNRCGNEYTYGHGTGTLWKHHKKCGGDQGQESAHVGAGATEQQPQPILPLPPPCASMDRWAVEASEHPTPGLEEEEEEEAAARRDLARMIALHGHHPSVVEDAHFKSFVQRLNPRFKLPSREDIEKVCYTVFTESWRGRPALKYKYYDAPGDHSFAVGKAKSVEACEALYITCNFIDDQWNLHRLVDHAYMVLPPGTPHRASTSTLSGVPAVPREAAAKCVVSYISRYDRYPYMVAGEIMSGIVGHLELKHLLIRPANVDTIFVTTNLDLVLHSIGNCLHPDSDHERDIFFAVMHSQRVVSCWTRQDGQKRLLELGLDDPLEFDEHWYLCYCWLKKYLRNFNYQPEYQTLRHIWETIYNAIKRISASSTPTSHLCLEELFKVRDALESQLFAAGAEYLPLTQTLEVVDVAIEDSYLVWSLPLVLDPRYKLRHIEEKFHKAFDDSKATNYISGVRRMIRVLYTRYTKNLEDNSNGEILAADSTSCLKNLEDNSHEEILAADNTSYLKILEYNSDEEMISVCSPFSSSPLQPATQQCFSADSTSSSDQARDKRCHSQDDNHVATKTELDDYLDDSLAHTTTGFDFDILNWWKVHGSVQYPTVARMARAALAMPTCSKLTSDQTAHVKSIIRGYTESESYW